jgi:predicted kinase
MIKSKVILCVGIPASGKTTWAKEQVKNGGGKWKRVNKDDLRAMVDCGQFSKSNEKVYQPSCDRWDCVYTWHNNCRSTDKRSRSRNVGYFMGKYRQYSI